MRFTRSRVGTTGERSCHAGSRFPKLHMQSSVVSELVIHDPGDFPRKALSSDSERKSRSTSSDRCSDCPSKGTDDRHEMTVADAPTRRPRITHRSRERFPTGLPFQLFDHQNEDRLASSDLLTSRTTRRQAACGSVAAGKAVTTGTSGTP